MKTFKPASLVESMLNEAQEVEWMNPSSQQAKDLIPDDILQSVPLGAKVGVIEGGEIANCFLYNNFKGGVYALIIDEPGGPANWVWFRNSEAAYQGFLERDVWAS